MRKWRIQYGVSFLANSISYTEEIFCWVDRRSKGLRRFDKDIIKRNLQVVNLFDRKSMEIRKNFFESGNRSLVKFSIKYKVIHEKEFLSFNVLLEIKNLHFVLVLFYSLQDYYLHIVYCIRVMFDQEWFTTCYQALIKLLQHLKRVDNQ